MKNKNTDMKNRFADRGKSHAGYFLRFVFCLVLTAAASLAQAQNRNQVSGKVTDKAGEPLIGATVVVVGTTTGATTGADGRFTIGVPAGGELKISYIGYVEQTVKVSAQSVLDIVLEEDSQMLKDVVVIGYGTMEKKSVTSSISSINAVKAPEVTDKASFLAAVRESGLVGLGGAGFPTDVKLQPKDPVDTLLINASECEVWLTSDTQEMLNCADDIVRGIEAVLKYTGIPKCVIGIENNKPECIDLLCQKTKDKPAIEVKPLPSVYGTGAELILIEKCLGREVPHGGLPAAAGAIVMNVTSVSSLGKYLATGMPVVSRVITVDGDACEKPQNLIVPVGTSYEDVLNTAGLKGGVTLGKVVAGGAMMGPAVRDLSYPTTKTTSGLIMLSEATAQPPQVNPCIRCGRCVEYCPMGLEPVEVNQAYAARDVQELGKLHVDYCFNCGSCTFVCPAKRPCTQMMGLAKAFYLGEIKKGGNK